MISSSSSWLVCNAVLCYTISAVGGTTGAFGRKENQVRFLNDEASTNRSLSIQARNATSTSAYPACNAEEDWTQCVGVHVNQPKGKPRIFCMVLAIHKEREQMLGILRTWGKQCDRVMFFADFDDASIGALHVRAEHEGSADSLINKMSRGVRIVATLFGSHYDWFVKADTDSFFIIENLRHFLLQRYDSEDEIALRPHYLGERFNKDGNPGQAFNPGAGYVLNRVALQLLACSFARPKDDRCTVTGIHAQGSVVMRHSSKHLARPFCIKGPPAYDCMCEPDKKGNHEDFMTAICLKHWGVLPDDTRDEQGRDYFYAYFDAPTAYVRSPPNNSESWFYKYSWARSDSNDYRERLATHPIVFHRYALDQHDQVHAAARKRIAAGGVG